MTWIEIHGWIGADIIIKALFSLFNYKPLQESSGEITCSCSAMLALSPEFAPLLSVLD